MGPEPRGSGPAVDLRALACPAGRTSTARGRLISAGLRPAYVRKGPWRDREHRIPGRPGRSCMDTRLTRPARPVPSARQKFRPSNGGRTVSRPMRFRLPSSKPNWLSRSGPAPSAWSWLIRSCALSFGQGRDRRADPQSFVQAGSTSIVIRTYAPLHLPRPRDMVLRGAPGQPAHSSLSSVIGRSRMRRPVAL